MPSKTCAVCKTMKTLPKAEHRLLDRDGDYVCSLDCLVGWIKTPRSFLLKRDIPKENWKVCGGGYRMGFRSLYEASLAEFFHRNGLMFLYEHIVFFWNGKTYTPDFFFPAYGCFVEAKGEWGPSNRSKYLDFRKTFNIPIVISHWLLSFDIPKARIIGA